jgi:hypothetical protein
MKTGFAQPGTRNTEQALMVMLEGLNQYQVEQVVVASTYGSTGLAAARLLVDKEINLVVVTHNVGFKEPGHLEMTAETREQLQKMGARVHTGTMPFRNIGTSIRERQGYSQQDLIANTLRLFGQGIKVCVEIVLMAADSGLINTTPVLAVAGTARGADTVALIRPQSSNRFFDLKVLDILVKPVKW